MRKKRYQVEQINDLRDKEFFVDANALLYVFFPICTKDNEEWIRKYSKIYRFIREKNSLAYVDVMVLSEVVNKAIRLKHDEYLESNRLTRYDYPFKKYRDSDEGKENLEIIYRTIKKQVLSFFKLCDKTYNMQDILDFMSLSKLDFVDKGIESICKEQDLVLITNDADFADSDIEILTANNRLL